MISRYRKYRVAFVAAIFAQGALLSAIYYIFCGLTGAVLMVPSCSPWIPRFLLPHVPGLLTTLSRPGFQIVPDFRLGGGWFGEWGWTLAAAVANVVIWTIAVGTLLVEAHRLWRAIVRVLGIGDARWFGWLRAACVPLLTVAALYAGVRAASYVRAQLAAEAFDDDIYAVYAAALRPLRVDRDALVHLDASTEVREVQLIVRDPAIARSVRDIPGITAELWHSFASANAAPNALRDGYFGPGVPVLLVRGRAAPLEHTFAVSNVGFDARRERALVYVGHHCGPMCGSTAVLLLTKRRNSWYPMRTFLNTVY